MLLLNYPELLTILFSFKKNLFHKTSQTIHICIVLFYQYQLCLCKIFFASTLNSVHERKHWGLPPQVKAVIGSHTTFTVSARLKIQTNKMYSNFLINLSFCVLFPTVTPLIYGRHYRSSIINSRQGQRVR